MTRILVIIVIIMVIAIMETCASQGWVHVGQMLRHDQWQSQYLSLAVNFSKLKKDIHTVDQASSGAC